MPTRIFLVPSVTDQEAAEAISRSVEDVLGVLKVDVTYHDGEVRVRYQKPATESEVLRAIENAGHRVTQ